MTTKSPRTKPKLISINVRRYLDSIKSVSLVVGELYRLVNFRKPDKSFTGRLIQVTPKGYNFLHEPTSTCIMTKAFYMCKGQTRSTNMHYSYQFNVDNHLAIEKVSNY